MSILVIVESPTKARTIAKFLPPGYEVKACMGHIRDLPGSASEIPTKFRDKKWAKDHGINVEDGFAPLYVVPSSKKRVVSDLKKALKEAEALVIATDEDREGESIGWHLEQVLKPKVPVRRMVFHEITRSAIESALTNERAIDVNLVRAQETRRVLDRLVGYTVSPLLWVKIAPGLSAGRVQSVAVRLLVRRERQRRAFRSGTYWELKSTLEHSSKNFDATLVRVDGQRVATGRDFDETTGELKKGLKVLRLDKERVDSLSAEVSKTPWLVDSVTRKARTLQPYPPFTTSTLQQEANRKLSLSARETMRIAQRLYERGLITYMRTDSVHLSSEATNAARNCVTKKYGTDYLPAKPRTFTNKSKGAQEAHEAIRPAGDQMLTADEVGVDGRERAVYDLIWKRTMATQMASAQQELVSITIRAGKAEFRTSGKRLIHPGFLRAYVEGSDDPNAALEDREVLLPNMQEGDSVDCKKLTPTARHTRPPVRYTEASLVETLEKEGIGRPSTYATIIDTILSREYARKVGTTLVPTFTAFGVTQLMEQNFQPLVDVGFTASMERTLDAVARGETEQQPYLESFWGGDSGLMNLVTVGREKIDPRLACTLGGFEDLPATVRIGRYGPYLEVRDTEEPLRVSLPPELAPSELTEAQASVLIREKAEGPTPITEEPETGEKVYVFVGRYGPYIQLGEGSDDRKPKRVSLPKGLKPENVDPETALALLSLPRTLGEHPDKKEPVLASIGRYGPYVSCAKEFRSLTKTDDVLTVELPRALELLAQEKPASRRNRASELRQVGAHPSDGEPVKLMDGRYGPYVSHGGINATVPKDVELDSLSLEQAVTLLERKAEQGPKKKRRRTRAKKKKK